MNYQNNRNVNPDVAMHELLPCFNKGEHTKQFFLLYFEFNLHLGRNYYCCIKNVIPKTIN